MSYCCGEEANVPGEELSSANKDQQQSKGKTDKACSQYLYEVTRCVVVNTWQHHTRQAIQGCSIASQLMSSTLGSSYQKTER